MKEALGLVETIGLSTAILAADVMAKTANVNIIGIENTKGSGYMTIKISGDVGAVNAAVTSGKQIAIENNAFVSSKVIPRPSNNIESTFCQPKDKEEDTSIIAESDISKDCRTIEKDIDIEKKGIVKDINITEINNNLENSEVIAEEVIVEAAKDSEDKQEEIIYQDEEVVESEKVLIESQEEISQQNESEIEIPQSQSGEKRTRRNSSRKKEK